MRRVFVTHEALFVGIGKPLERRFGMATRQVVTASVAGLITGVAIYLFPLAFGSGKDTMAISIRFSSLPKNDPMMKVPELLGVALAKSISYWACAHGGLVGGIFFPLLYYGMSVGAICSQLFDISRGSKMQKDISREPHAMNMQ